MMSTVSSQDRFGYIYKITNKNDGRIYIGQHKSSTLDENYWGSGIYISRAIAKYGTSMFNREIVEWCASRDELNNKEMKWIAYYNSTNPKLGYNICTGGSVNDSFKGRTHTQETKDKMSQNQQGASNSFYGKRHTAKSIEKMREAHLGIKFTDEHKEKLRQANLGANNPRYGSHPSEETRRKMSISHSGKNNPNYGKKTSEETKALMREAARNRRIEKYCAKCGSIFITNVGATKYCGNCKKK